MALVNTTLNPHTAQVSTRCSCNTNHTVDRCLQIARIATSQRPQRPVCVIGNMDPKHRKIITDNMVHLVEKTNDVGLEMLIDYLDPRDSMRKLNFFNDIQTRGPLAFNKFINALVEAERNDLVQLLKPNNAPTARTNTASRNTSS
ncbi:hypothetical protein B566_EDAN017710, partial [Ephemera danica]